MTGALLDRPAPGPGSLPSPVDLPAPGAKAPETSSTSDGVQDVGAAEKTPAAGGAPTTGVAPTNGHAAPVPAADKADDASAPQSDKRKAEETNPADGDVIEKKAKTEAAAPANDATANGSGSAPKKVGRPRGKKITQAVAAAAGRTARKTRSQGPVEG